MISVTVITPVRNGERFIESCLLSVIEQGYPAVEHVVVDGSSTDRTIEIVRRFASEHRHIRWLSEPDAGEYDAINKGCSIAGGAIIGVLNVDDFYEPLALERAMRAFGEHPGADMIVGNCRILDENDQVVSVNRPSSADLVELLCFESEPLIPVNPAQYFYRRELHDLVGPYDVTRSHVMDMDFLFRVYASGRVVYIDETLGNFRLIPGAKTYEDMAAGTAAPRFRALVREHRARLPVRGRARLMLKILVYRANRLMRTEVAAMRRLLRRLGLR